MRFDRLNPALSKGGVLRQAPVESCVDRFATEISAGLHSGYNWDCFGMGRDVSSEGLPESSGRGFGPDFSSSEGLPERLGRVCVLDFPTQGGSRCGALRQSCIRIVFRYALGEGLGSSRELPEGLGKKCGPDFPSQWGVQVSGSA